MSTMLKGAGAVPSPAGVLDAVQAMSGTELGELPDPVLLDRLRDLNRLRCAVDAAMTHTVGAVHTRGAGSYDAAVSTRSWMRTQLRMSDPAAGAYLDAATALPDLPELAAEFTAGRVGLDHVGVLAWLRKKTGPEIAAIGDRLLTSRALGVNAKELRRLAVQIREHFLNENDPDPRPEPARYLTLNQTLDGVWGLDATLTPEAGAVLRTALDAMTTRPAPEDTRTPAERRHDALVDLINLSLNNTKLPHQGGEPVHLGVLIPLGDLRDQHTNPCREQGKHSPGLAEEIAAYLTNLDNDNDPDSNPLGYGPGPDGGPPDHDLGPDGGPGPIPSPGYGADPYDDPPNYGSGEGIDWPWPIGWTGDIDLNDLIGDIDLADLIGGVRLDDLTSDHHLCNSTSRATDPRTTTTATSQHEKTGTHPQTGPDNREPDQEPGKEPDTEPGWTPPGWTPRPPRPAGPPDALARQLVLPGLGTNRSRMPQPGQGARTDYGDYLTPDAARRLACDCALMRVVLGPKDTPLRASQRTRLVPAALRRILTARDGGCRFPGCDRPPAYTQAHHVTFWADGGLTILENLVLLCSYHHHRVHDDHWTLHFDGTTVTVYRPDGTLLQVPGEAPGSPSAPATATASDLGGSP